MWKIIVYLHQHGSSNSKQFFLIIYNAPKESLKIHEHTCKFLKQMSVLYFRKEIV